VSLKAPRLLVAATALGALCGCVTRPPSIAHVHIGHAITGVHITPGHKGYVLVAQQRAEEAATAAAAAGQATDLTQLKTQVAAAAVASNSEDSFGVKQSVTLAANHIAFAATSADASQNVIDFAPGFKADTSAVVARCDYISLLAKDVATATSMKEAQVLVAEITKATRANLAGADGPNGRGARPADYGLAQLNAEIQAMLARENPPYRTVDQWYLFNLVRLPNGRWVFDKFSRGGNIDGYK
jgi:hypothetical protein